jgi:hypothetical protein
VVSIINEAAEKRRGRRQADQQQSGRVPFRHRQEPDDEKGQRRPDHPAPEQDQPDGPEAIQSFRRLTQIRFEAQGPDVCHGENDDRDVEDVLHTHSSKNPVCLLIQ